LPQDAKAKVAARLEAERWTKLQARPEQLPPRGDWQVWYVRGGRGGGKTRTGSETLAGWIYEEWDDPGEWAIIAPTFGDARAVCAESRESGLIKIMGGLEHQGGLVRAWNRSEGVLHILNGSIVYLDGANDGAYRIQGKNLKGAWCDEVGLWEKWDVAWNESLRQAVRMKPGLVIATGTPKVGHPLVAQLMASPRTAQTVIRTLDNIDNLNPASVHALYEDIGGTTLGRQELEGEFIEALEGSILNRHHWRYFDCRSNPVDEKTVGNLPRFDQIVHTWDTAVKGKTSNDPVAGQVWGILGPDRYLLRIWAGQASFDATIIHMQEFSDWARSLWPHTPHRILIETAANGADAIKTMRARVDGIHGYNPRDGGDKVRRAFAASPALETGHCYLPGFADPDPNGKGYRDDTPGEVQAFVEECAMFRGDMKHLHDDQVDAWSQMVNWTRQPVTSRARIGRPSGKLPRPGSLAGTRP
jgi:phage terminase large subunit-like protein